MSPTVFRHKGFRFYFFSREEARKHVHVYCTDGEAKYWIDPEVLLAKNHGLSQTQLTELEKIVKDKKDDITDSWNRHFGN